MNQFGRVLTRPVHSRGRQRLAVAVVACLVILALPRLAVAEPTPTAGTAVADTADELREKREELDTARGRVATADGQVEAALEELDAVEGRLQAASAELARLQDERAEAREAHESAQRATEAINARLRSIDDNLDTLTADSANSRERLADHAASAYMHGGAARSGAMYTAVLGSRDLHGVSVGLRVVAATLADDEELVDDTRRLAVTTARARGEVTDLRAERLRQQERAAEAYTRVRELTADQERVTASIAAERERRAEILETTRQDRQTAAALVATLEETTQRLSAELARARRDALRAAASAAVSRIDWQDVTVTGPMPDWAGRLPDHGRRWAPAVADAAEQVGVDPRLFAALVWAESNFHPGAVSHVGATGLAQLMPATAASLGVDPRDPIQNLAGGAAYLSAQLAAFDSAELALAAYNAGPGAVARHGGVPPYPETQYYVVRVLRYYERLAA